jgi:hypothetical protein
VDVKVCLKEVHELVLNKVNVTTCTVQKQRIKCTRLAINMYVHGSEWNILYDLLEDDSYGTQNAAPCLLAFIKVCTEKKYINCFSQLG